MNNVSSWIAAQPSGGSATPHRSILPANFLRMHSTPPSRLLINRFNNLRLDSVLIPGEHHWTLTGFFSTNDNSLSSATSWCTSGSLHKTRITYKDVMREPVSRQKTSTAPCSSIHSAMPSFPHGESMLMVMVMPLTSLYGTWMLYCLSEVPAYKHSMENIKELAIPVCSRSNDLIGITETVGPLTWPECCRGWLCTF